MVNVKMRHILYHYGSESAAAAKERAVELRSNGANARTIDATNFTDKEDADKIEYIGDFPAGVKATIQSAYEGFDRRTFTRELSEHNEDGTVAVDIPQQWDQMSFPEMQKLAAAISDEAVRTREAAMEIILAELERREDKMKADLGNGPATGLDGANTNSETGNGDTDEDEGDDTDKLDDMTKAELIDYAEEKEIDLGDASKKADILAAIRAHKE